MQHHQLAPPPQHPQMGTAQCAYCGIQLSYPSTAMYIRCPACHNTMDLTQSYVHCVSCNTLLSHPVHSPTIQCPKCKAIMDLPQTNLQAAVQHQPLVQQQRKPKKKRKDPHAPKRAANAYMIFCRERRADLKKERPDLPFGQLGAKLGQIWRTMSQQEKKPYEEKAAQDRERYKLEMANYSANNSGGDGNRPAKKLKEDTGAAPAPAGGAGEGAGAPVPPNPAVPPAVTQPPLPSSAPLPTLDGSSVMPVQNKTA